MSNKLFVYQSTKDANHIDADEVVFIDEIFENVSEDRFHEAFRLFSELDIPQIAGFPLYDVLWPRFAQSFFQLATDPKGLSHLVVLYEELTKIIDSKNITTIECVGVDDYYISVIEDLAENEDLDLTGGNRSILNPRLWGFIIGLWKLFLSVIDNILSIGLKYFFTDFGREVSVLFIPNLNRFDSMEPVIQAADYPYRVIAPVPTLEWIFALITDRWASASGYDPVPIGCFVTPRMILREIHEFGLLTIDEIFRATFKRELSDAISREFDIKLDRSISHSLGNTYKLHLSALPNFYLTDNMIQSTECEKIVVGAMSLRLQAILHVAEANDVLTFHLPHTVPVRQPAFPRTNTIEIVPGKASRNYLAHSPHIRNESLFEPLGRPLFAELIELSDNLGDNDRDQKGLRFVIATQAVSDSIRYDFVKKIVDSIKQIEQPVQVRIKIHPNEDPSFYADFENTSEINISIHDSALYDHLFWGDLTFIISSNVGLESILLGTPCVSVNLWSPRVFIRPFTESDPIPLLTSEEALVDFLTELDQRQIDDLRHLQQKYLQDNYCLEPNIGKNIAEYIKNA